jgi:hypothetical protein
VLVVYRELTRYLRLEHSMQQINTSIVSFAYLGAAYVPSFPSLSPAITSKGPRDPLRLQQNQTKNCLRLYACLYASILRCTGISIGALLSSDDDLA